MLGLEGPKSYQPGYATSACLLCWRSQVGHKPNTTWGGRLLEPKAKSKPQQLGFSKKDVGGLCF